MPMNKREQAEVENLRQQLAEAKALRFLGVPEPARMPLPETGYINGWEFNAYSTAVGTAWTSANAHSRFSHRTDDNSFESRREVAASQNGRRLYATQLDALIALRLAKEREFAAELGKLDVKEARYLLSTAVKFMEAGMKAERLELGESTENITNIAPPKALEDMTDAELEQYIETLDPATKGIS